MKHFSASSLEMLARCPRQYMYRYVLGYKVPPQAAQIFGDTYHSTIEDNFRHKVLTGKDLPVEQAKAVFSDRWEKSDVKDGALKDVGIGLVESYINTVAPNRKPVVVEHEFRLEPKESSSLFVGRIDFIGDGGIIVEHKTSSKQWPQARADNSIQGTGYVYAYKHLFGETPSAVLYDVAIKDKTRSIQTLQTMRDARSLREFEERLRDAERMVKAEIFPRTDPSNWWCSYMFCGYYQHCKMGIPLSSLNLYREIDSDEYAF